MSPSPLRTVPPAWRFALIGALASLPVTVLINWLPNSEADFEAGITIFGAFIAGSIAALRSTDPDAAGYRAGLLGGVMALLTLFVAAVRYAIENIAIAWPLLSSVVILVVGSTFILVFAPLVGSVCGRIGGWVVTTLTTRSEVG